jgi:hypothetical protein
MNESKTDVAGDELIELLRDSLSGSQSFGYLVLYTSFGVVRGRTGLAFTQEAASDIEAETARTSAIIALNDVTVEHYSNHLPSATFDRLYVRLTDIQGFTLVDNHGQG